MRPAGRPLVAPSLLLSLLLAATFIGAVASQRCSVDPPLERLQTPDDVQRELSGNRRPDARRGTGGHGRPGQLSALLAPSPRPFHAASTGQHQKIKRSLQDDADGSRSFVLLEYLDVSYCNIFRVSPEEEDVLSRYNTLRVLNMSHNMLQSVPSRTFVSLINLEVLDLSHNRLTSAPSLYIGINVLQCLDLSWNRITFPGKIIANGSVVFLNLSHNAVDEWYDPKQFMNPEGALVFSLNMSYNRIKSFSPEMIASFEDLESVDLGGNPYSCSECNTSAFAKWFGTKRSPVILNLGREMDLQCDSPLEVRGLSIVAVSLNASICAQGKRSVLKVLVLGVSVLSLSATTALLIVASIGCYGKRYDVVYALHLMRITLEWRRHLSGKFKYDSFVIFAEEDGEWVWSEVLSPLQAPPATLLLCSMDADFALGSDALANFSRGVRASRAVLVIISAAFVRSKWCLWQLEQATRLLGRRRLVLAVGWGANRAALPRLARFLLDTRAYVAWPSGPRARAAALRRLHTALRA